MDIRENAEKLAAEYIDKGKPLDWFDALYREAGADHAHIPWADLEPNRFLVAWANEVGLEGGGRSALVVGCGLGDDAKFLLDLGFRVTAFDVSPKAIEWAKQIHAGSEIVFRQADLFHAPEEWKNAFDFVLEVYTIQALPPELRTGTIDAIGSFPAAGGALVVVARGHDDDEETDRVPWPLSRRDLSRFESNGFNQLGFTEMLGDEEEPVSRFVAEYRKTV